MIFNITDIFREFFKRKLLFRKASQPIVFMLCTCFRLLSSLGAHLLHFSRVCVIRFQGAADFLVRVSVGAGTAYDTQPAVCPWCLLCGGALRVNCHLCWFKYFGLNWQEIEVYPQCVHITYSSSLITLANDPRAYSLCLFKIYFFLLIISFSMVWKIFCYNLLFSVRTDFIDFISYFYYLYFIFYCCNLKFVSYLKII